MIWEQLESRGVTDAAILDAFEKIPRHLFIPHVSLEQAYGDYPIGIKAGQTISQPFIVALMIQYLDLTHQHQLLEIGSGSGYATALLSLLCKQVDALEVYSDLLEDSRKVIQSLDRDNVRFIHQSAWEHIDSNTVYDRIVLWASPPRVPAHLFDILSDEGGVLVSPEGKYDQYVNIYTKRSGKIQKNRRDAVRFVPLVQGTLDEIDR
ncbi:MAG: protein-L-isoaspartate O-methyltransferase [Candidatus Marinimicrobia bacterium]|nr:protein-L-isoaspartate O-methyltransferase [Candidatus Neomarinimicrobiota bacterium]